MVIDDNVRQAAHSVLERHLERSNGRKTTERFAILDAVLDDSHHFTVAGVRDTLQQRDFHVSLTTVYSTLAMLCECGLLLRHTFGKRTAQYERRVDHLTGTKPHLHLVCNVCGRVKEMRNPADILAHLAEMHIPGFHQTRVEVTLHGVCSTCTRAQKRRAAQQK